MQKRGFTLIELMIVISVIAILSALSLFGIQRARMSARNTSRYQRVTALQAALESCYANGGSYPLPAAFNAAGCVGSAYVTTAVPGSTITEGYTYTGGGACYNLQVNIEPSGLWPTTPLTCPL